MEKIVVDAMGKVCPIPVVMAKKAVTALTEPAEVEVHVDNTTSVENLKRLASSLGVTAAEATIGENHYTVTFHADAGAIEGAAGAAAQEVVDACSNTGAGLVYAIGTEVMGQGDDELGAQLMKTFMYALRSADVLPEKILFFNTGAKLTAEGSPVLEDLQAMEEEGVQIMTCGVCAGHFGLKEKIQAGIISNMYEIVETMNAASKGVRI